MKVIGFDPMVTADRAAQLGVELCTLDEIFTRADAITVHTPMTAQTKGLVNKDVLPRLKRGVLLVNAARGGIHDEAALLEGLEGLEGPGSPKCFEDVKPFVARLAS